MSRVYLLVEGQTEEAFANELLAPHCAGSGVYLIPMLLRTSPGHHGGVVGYGKARFQIEKICKQHAKAHVSTLFDLYALRSDFPGKRSPKFPATADGRSKAQFLEAELGRDIGLSNFIPNLLVHEFEALLFSNIDAFKPLVDDDRALKPLRDARGKNAPEGINDGPQTAPSKRILDAIPEYRKKRHGPLIASTIGLAAIRAACPHFDAWLRKIEGLA